MSRQEWLERIALLRRFTRAGCSKAKVRELPWVKVEDVRLIRRVGRGRWRICSGTKGATCCLSLHVRCDVVAGCKSCSFIADHYNPLVIHLAA